VQVRRAKLSQKVFDCRARVTSAYGPLWPFHSTAPEPPGADSPATDKTPVEVGFDAANEIWWELTNLQDYDSHLNDAFEQLKIEHPDLRKTVESYQLSNKDIFYGLAQARRDLQLKKEGEQQ
jgi:hypothetical protein